MFFTEAVDIECQTRDEMLQPLHRLRRANECADAAPHNFTFFPHRVTAADRTGVRKRIRLRMFRALIEEHADDLRDHVARALDHDGVAFTDILARNFVLVVQRGVLHNDSADRHRREPRHRGQ
jgi:hypothetical protein